MAPDLSVFKITLYERKVYVNVRLHLTPRQKSDRKRADTCRSIGGQKRKKGLMQL